jgi:hypothetical protein
MKGHLVLMAKTPQMGRVKTRLAADIGLVQAWAFHRRCLAAAARTLVDSRWTCWLAIAPDTAAADLHFDGWTNIAQGGGDLGARMFKPMQILPPGPVVIVGSDIPGIRTRHIDAAFKILGDHDWAFGPATDGGYWLVGARRRPHLIDPFQGVRWSSEHALADTVANLPKNARVGWVETLSDVDEAIDLIEP